MTRFERWYHDVFACAIVWCVALVIAAGLREWWPVVIGGALVFARVTVPALWWLFTTGRTPVYPMAGSRVEPRCKRDRGRAH